MPDLPISGRPAAGALSDADVLAIVTAGTTSKVTLSQLTAYFESRSRQNNASIAGQTGFAADTYLAGSDVAVPAGRLQPRSSYFCRFNATKTAAGTAAPVFALRFGPAGSLADAAVTSFTFGAGTAIVDEAVIEVFASFRAVGASAVLQAVCLFQHRFSNTGFISGSAGTNTTLQQLSGTFDSTVAGAKLGLSVNGGASAAWTVNLVQASLSNLA